MAGLTIWTIFQNPRDYPGKWVLRASVVGPDGIQPSAECVVADTLQGARLALPPGLAHLPRHPNDDPVIYESWV